MAVDNDKIKMQINIAGERISLTVGFDEQDAVREAEASVATLFKEWRSRFPKKTVQELLAMIAYQYASYYLALRGRHEEIIKTLTEFENRIDEALEKSQEE